MGSVSSSSSRDKKRRQPHTALLLNHGALLLEPGGLAALYSLGQGQDESRHELHEAVLLAVALGCTV
ncbi:hypothetical protein CGRA01v4_13720 [Colletotrichum graminicola]|nr:hypothetical protein CGRA01v4_13720 [Colletotrichum graminicola]